MEGNNKNVINLGRPEVENFFKKQRKDINQVKKKERSNTSVILIYIKKFKLITNGGE